MASAGLAVTSRSSISVPRSCAPANSGLSRKSSMFLFTSLHSPVGQWGETTPLASQVGRSRGQCLRLRLDGVDQLGDRLTDFPFELRQPRRGLFAAASDI